MPIPAGATHIVIAGTLPNGEEFSFGYWVDSGTVNQTGLNGIQGSASLALVNNFLTTGVKALFYTGIVFTSLTAYYYDGGSTAALVSGGALSPSVAGTGAAQTLPNQIALVVSLLTGLPGRRRRGRAYLPPVIITAMGSTGLATTSAATTLVNAFASMLSAVKDSPTSPAEPVVMSRVGTSMTPITQCRVDTRFDVHRSRASSETGAVGEFANVT